MCDEKKLLLTACAVAALTTQGAAPEKGFAEGKFRSSQGHELPYRLYTPKLEKNKKYPLIIHFHGAGSWDEGNSAQLRQACRIVKKNYPAFILAPKTYRPMKWANLDWTKSEHVMKETPTASMAAVHELVQKMLAENPRLDRARIYVNGQSMGGFGTWDFICRYPELPAAAVPVCGGGDPAQMAKLKNLPIWIFHGALDNTVLPENSRILFRELQKQENKLARYTEYPGVMHDAWVPAYEDPELFAWLFSQKKVLKK